MNQGEIVGSLMFSRYRFDRLVHGGEFGVTVLPEFQGHGLGSVMIDSMISWAISVGIERIDLKVHDDNLGAIKLYKKFGFVQYGLLPTMLKYKSGKYIGVVHMTKELSREHNNDN